MILEYLVRNYYKRHGNFDGIMSTFLKNAINNAALQNGAAEEDLLYAALGCRTVLVCAHGLAAQISPAQYFLLQKAYYLGDVDTINKLLRPVEILLNKSECKRLFPVFGQGNIKYFGKLEEHRNVKVLCDFPQYVHMIYRYCMESTDRHIFILPNNEDSVSLTFAEFYNYALMSGKPILKKKPVWMGALPQIAHCAEIENPIIINKKLYVPENLTKTQIKKIYSDVCGELERIADLRKIIDKADFGQLAFLDHVNGHEYLRVQAAASALGISYNQFISYFGMKVPDELQIFSSTGMLVYKIGEKLVCSYQDALWDRYIYCSDPISVSDFESCANSFQIDTGLSVSENTVKNLKDFKNDSRYRFNLDDILQADDNRMPSEGSSGQK